MRRAVCIGCNYPDSQRPLFGCVNDALGWRQVLEDKFQFECRLLVDQHPDGTHAGSRPTAAAVRDALQWLTTCRPGDAVVLTFSGHATRAAAACDASGDALVLPGEDQPQPFYFVEVQALLARLPPGCGLTVVLDTGLGASAFAPRSERAALRQSAHAWQHATHALARPRVWEGLAHRPPPQGVVPWGEDPVHPAVTALLFCASRDDQVPLEATIRGKLQGVLSFCLQEALVTLGHVCTYDQLCRQAAAQLRDLHARYLPSLDQEVVLLSGPHAPPAEVAVFDTRYAHVAAHRFFQGKEARDWAPAAAPRVPEHCPSFLL